MTLPASWQKLGRAVQSTDGQNSETYTVPSAATGYHLGAGLTPPQPADWINIPDGAFPLSPPAAPTTGPGTGFAGGGLTANSAYTWALTAVTDYGETPLGPQLVVPNTGAYTGYVLALPAVSEGTTDNPVRRRRLYRTVAGGAQLKFVCEISDLSLTTWRDYTSDPELGDNAPATNTSGVTGIVTLSGVGVSVWTERGPATPQGSLGSGDFVVNRQTGAIIHATADYNRQVTVAWSGATLDTSSLVNDQVAAIQDIGSAVGAAGGIASLNADRKVVQPTAKGVLVLASLSDNASDDHILTPATQSLQSGPATSFGGYQQVVSLPFVSSGGDVRVTFSGMPWNLLGANGNWIRIALAVDATGVFSAPRIIDYALASSPNQSYDSGISGVVIFPGLPAGPHIAYVLGQCGGPGNSGNAAGFLGRSHAFQSGLNMLVEEHT